LDNDKLHKHIAKGFGHHDISPAALAYKMLQESRYVNEQVLGYLINYIIVMADHPIIPLRLAEVHETCKSLKISLEELGLTGITGEVAEPSNEYLSV
jgi:pyrroloquinoline quinone (PQQ) biosynthesis protein C